MPRKGGQKPGNTPPDQSLGRERLKNTPTETTLDMKQNRKSSQIDVKKKASVTLKKSQTCEIKRPRRTPRMCKVKNMTQTDSPSESNCDDPTSPQCDDDIIHLSKNSFRTSHSSKEDAVSDIDTLGTSVKPCKGPVSCPSSGSTSDAWLEQALPTTSVRSADTRADLSEVIQRRWMSLSITASNQQLEILSSASSDTDQLRNLSDDDRFILDLDRQNEFDKSMVSSASLPCSPSTSGADGPSAVSDDQRPVSRKKLIALSTGGKSDSASRPRRWHQCETCDKVMSTRSDLVKHMRTHTGERPYACDVCDARFTQLGSLRAHQTRHSGVRPFVCQICQRGFSIRERLKMHMRVHTGHKPFRCRLCDKTFARGSQLIQHRRTHTGDKPYACAHCNMRFAFATNLRLHEKKHTGAKDFKCPRCFKGFLRQDALRRHVQSYHENERPMRCPVCDKTFKGHLSTHLRVHTQERPFRCTQCSAAFAQKSQLTVHQRTHSGDKPYCCQVCSQKFAHSTALKVHIRQHTGERPYRCPLCHVTFNQLPHLKKHLRTIHQQSLPYMCGACKRFFKTKSERQLHVTTEHSHVPPPRGAEYGVVDHVRRDITEPETQPETVTRGGVPMSRLRAHLAILLNKISSKKRLVEFGFGRRLIDEVLCDSLEKAGKTPVIITKQETAAEEVAGGSSCSADEALRANIQMLLDWTVPTDFMQQYRQEQRTVEEILEELAS